MIVGTQKPLDEIWGMLPRVRRLLVAGCGGCATVCDAGGAKEVEALAARVRERAKAEGRAIDVATVTLERQCDPQYLGALAGRLDGVDAVLASGCGAGVQHLAERNPAVVVLPGLNTRFIGVTESQGVFAERCRACGSCRLHLTVGICPITRCAKSLLNGLCGGAWDGKCEVGRDVPCAWLQIAERLRMLGRLEVIEEFAGPHNWAAGYKGGPRRVVRDDITGEKT